MRIWITGASGWIGYHLVQVLTAHHPEHELRLFLPPAPLHPPEARRAQALRDRGFAITHWDLLEPPPEDLDSGPIDILVHLAAYTHTETRNSAMRVNDLGTENLLRVLGSRLRNSRVLFMGSIASIDAFPPPASGVDETSPCRPLTRYGRTKLAAERIIQDNASRYGYIWTILRLPTVHGFGEHRPGGLFDQLKQHAHSWHPLVSVDWQGALTLLDVEDVAQLIPRVWTNMDCAYRLFHVGHPKPVRFAALAEWAECAHATAPRRRFRLPAQRLVPILILLLRSAILPHALHIALWRLSHLMGNSMVFDTRAFDQICPVTFSDPRPVLKRLFQETTS